jgi:serine protein kinase
MEALRDRTIKIDIPYITRMKDEIRIYDRNSMPRRCAAEHRRVRSRGMWAVLRGKIEEAQSAALQKMKLDGKVLPGYARHGERAPQKGKRRAWKHQLRYIQDKISNAW